jgi:hypothetical protein
MKTKRGFCSIMDLSGYAQISYTRGFEGEEFKKKVSVVGN